MGNIFGEFGFRGGSFSVRLFSFLGHQVSFKWLDRMGWSLTGGG